MSGAAIVVKAQLGHHVGPALPQRSGGEFWMGDGAGRGVRSLSSRWPGRHRRTVVKGAKVMTALSVDRH